MTGSALSEPPVFDASPRCPSCVEWQSGLFSELPPDQARQLSAVSVRRLLPAGAELHSVSNLHDSCICLLKGVVKVSRLLADGRQQIVALKSAPDILGRPFSAESEVSVRAVTETEICSVPRAVFEGIVRRNRDLEHRLHLHALEELNRTEALLLTLGRKTARERIATFLLDIGGRLGGNGTARPCEEAGTNSALDLPLTRAEIGDFLGLTFETVSRHFHALRREGMIDFSDPRRVTIKDCVRLRIASGC